jgi:hypothetical protein
MQKGNAVCCGCGACEVVGERGAAFPFCGACLMKWQSSGERRRALKLMYHNEPAALTAVEDFIRRIQAERRNGEA